MEVMAETRMLSEKCIWIYTADVKSRQQYPKAHLSNHECQWMVRRLNRMQGFHMQICSLIIPWQMEYVEVYSLHISVILFNCPSVRHGQSFYNKLVLETYNEDLLMVLMVADNKVLSVNQHNPILWMWP